MSRRLPACSALPLDIPRLCLSERSRRDRPENTLISSQVDCSRPIAVSLDLVPLVLYFNSPRFPLQHLLHINQLPCEAVAQIQQVRVAGYPDTLWVGVAAVVQLEEAVDDGFGGLSSIKRLMD